MKKIIFIIIICLLIIPIVILCQNTFKSMASEKIVDEQEQGLVHKGNTKIEVGEKPVDEQGQGLVFTPFGLDTQNANEVIEVSGDRLRSGFREREDPRKIIKHNIKKPEIKYLKPTDRIGWPTERSGVGIKAPEEQNYIYAIKEGNKEYVKVVSRYNGLEYPDLELVKHVDEFYNGERYIIGKKAGKYGVITIQGRIIIPFKFDIPATPAIEGYYYLRSDKGMSLVNKDGKEIIPCEYNQIKVINEKYIYAYTSKGNGIIDYKNKTVIPLEYGYIDYVDEVFICANKPDINDNKYNSNNIKNKGYVINIKNKILHEYKGVVRPLREHRFVTMLYKPRVFTKKILLLDSNHRNIVDINGKEIIGVWAEGYDVYPVGIVCRDSNNGYVIIDNEGKIIYESNGMAYGYYNSFLIIHNDPKDFKYGLMDTKGKFILEVEYSKQIRPTIHDKTVLGPNGLPKILRSEEYRYIGFVKDSKSVVVNLDTFEKKEYNFEIESLDNTGQVYVREPSKEIKGAFSIVPYKE
ncbi:MAG: WG repeat-containing protein [Abditibacteriota bacterium]|nr:WG repeat-containing protein [Abditibacteriota bacterium]